MKNYINIFLLLSFAVSLISLIILKLKVNSYEKKTSFSKPNGCTKEGVIYSFTKGMSPFEKDSAKKHLPSYIAGIVYHLAIFTIIAYILMLAFSFNFSKELVSFVSIISLSGFVCGFSLFLKRVFSKSLRIFSNPDDFVSNLLVTSMLFFGFIHNLYPNLTVFLLINAAVLFLYIPFGKIRHCIFFFSVRMLLGQFFGKRGVFPTHKKSEG